MNFGRLGRVFGRLGAQVKAPTAGGGGGGGATADFSTAANSMYVPLLFGGMG